MKTICAFIENLESTKKQIFYKKSTLLIKTKAKKQALASKITQPYIRDWLCIISECFKKKITMFQLSGHVVIC